MENYSRPLSHVLQSALEAAGLEPSEWPGRTSLMLRALDAFTSATGSAPAWAWLVPGRIEVFGKHTDYAGGKSLVAAVPRGFAMVASPRDDGRVVARDARWNASTVIHTNDQATTFHGWANYIAVVTRRLMRNFPGATLGLDVTFVSDLPRAAGVSSSSALVVGIALALIHRGGLEQRPEWQAVIHDRLDLAGYLGAVENGLTFRSLAGTSGVGTHGGSEDHTAILNSRPGAVSAFSYVPTRALGEAHVPDDWRFIIMPSGIEAAKAGGARIRYNTASLATQALTEVWRRHTGDTAVRTLADVLGSGADAEAALREAIAHQPHADFSREALDRRLAHFMGEDARVLPALAAFWSADRERLSALTLASQIDAETLLGNQIPETSALAALAREAGAFASSSFGAGFGGSVWALATAGDAEAVTDRWRAAYAAAFPAVTIGVPSIVRPGTAAMMVELPAGGKIES